MWNFYHSGFIATIKEKNENKDPAKSLRRWVASDMMTSELERYPQMDSIIIKEQQTTLIIFNLNMATWFSKRNFSWNLELEKWLDKVIIG